MFTLRPDDHAFASGHAFAPVSSQKEALAALQSKVAVADERDAAQLVAIWRQFREGGVIGANLLLGLGARLVNLGAAANARIAGDSVIRGVLRLEPSGELEIGRFCYLGDGVLVSAQAHVGIGEATLLAHGVQVFDNNSHPISAAQREVQFRRMMGDKSRSGSIQIDSAPISIGRRCWIGMNSIVMKGVTIGDDTIVAAGSVVVDSLPAAVIAAGNPARVLRALDPADPRPPSPSA